VKITQIAYNPLEWSGRPTSISSPAVPRHKTNKK